MAFLRGLRARSSLTDMESRTGCCLALPEISLNHLRPSFETVELARGPTLLSSQAVDEALARHALVDQHIRALLKFGRELLKVNAQDPGLLPIEPAGCQGVAHYVDIAFERNLRLLLTVGQGGRGLFRRRPPLESILPP